MANRRLLPAGSTSRNAPQVISNPTSNPTSNPKPESEGLGLPCDDLFEFYYTNILDPTAPSQTEYTNTSVEYYQNPLPNIRSEFHDSKFYNPQCYDSGPFPMTAQINAGFPHCNYISQLNPSVNTGLAIASNATGLPTNWSNDYKASPAPGQYNPSQGHFMPVSMPPDELMSFPVIPGYDYTSLVEETKLVPGSNSSEILPGSKCGPVFPNNPPQPGRRSQNIAEQPRRIQTNPRTRGLNKRSQNIQNLDPTEFYDSLPGPPPSWTSEEKEDEDKFMFEYNGYGELSARIRLNKRQMKAFLYQHPLNNVKGELAPRKGALTLWVQTVPADSNTRYSAFGSDKCRFAECPVRNNTIHKGFYRVAIDENHHSGIKVNPYYCAGFVHLYCLEKFLDFQDLCKHVNVQPDNRLLAEPKNKMALTRDHDELFEVAKEYIENSEHTQGGDFKKTQATRGNFKKTHAPGWDFKKSLSHVLTEKHLTLEPRSRSRKRQNLGGNHLSRHRGDLELFVEGERLKFEGRKRIKEERDKDGDKLKLEGRKRGRADEDEDGERGEPPTKQCRIDGSPDKNN